MFEKKINISEIMSVIYVSSLSDKQLHTRYGSSLSRHELVYKISGKSVTTFNGKSIPLNPGTVEFLPKCEKADYFVDRIEFGDCIDIFFDTTCPIPEKPFSIDCSTNKKLASMFHKIYQLWVNKQDGYYYKCMALLYEILVELSKPYGHYISTEKYKKIERGIEYLHTHAYDRDIDYYMPSTLCQISYTYFKRLFMQKFDFTPVQYVTRLRMERAVELLTTARYTITEISQLCGFDNVYYFSTVFKKHTGISPSKYNCILNK